MIQFRTVRWVVHGRPGELCFKGKKLDVSSLQNPDQLALAREALKDADALELISCRVAAGSGRQFVRRLAQALGVRVFASSRPVGPSRLGGTYFLDFGYCPFLDRDLPGYEADPVPGLNHLMATLSVPFENGIVGDQGTNPNKTLALTNFSTLNIQISFFQQNSNTGQFVDGGSQGNDIPGFLKIVLSDGTSYSISGAINWQDKTGNTTETFGFLPGDDTDISVRYANGAFVPIPTYDNSGNVTGSEDWIIRGANHASGRISNFGLEKINNGLSYTDGDNNSGSADPVDVNDLNAYLAVTQANAPDGYVTVDGTIASDSTPVITGTFDIDRSNSETLSLTVDGQFFDENDSELTLTFDSGGDGTGTWSLDLNDDPSTGGVTEGKTLVQGTDYDVEAIITDGTGYTLQDSSIDEVSIQSPSVAVNDISVNEASGYAVFQVTTQSNTLIELALQSGTATAGIGNDYASSGAAIQYSVDGGANWQDYIAAVSASVTGTILARTAINNDATSEGDETFILSATIQGTATTDNGTATISDDGTGTIFLGDGSVDNATTPDDDRAVTVNNITVNEGSPYAVFTVSGAAGQLVTLSLPGVGTATGGGTDYGSALEYWNGVAWASYAGGSTIALDGGGDVLVRVAVVNDGIADDGETFTLQASNTGGIAGTGTATIKDDGTGTLYPDLAPTNSTTPATDNATTPDDDRAVTVNNITVNEGSPYAVFTVSGAAGQLVTLSLPGVGTATGGGTDYGSALEYWNGVAWASYAGGSTIALDGGGDVLVRVAVVNDGIADDGETFTLQASNTGGIAGTGTATIKDDGTGTLYPDLAPTNSTTPATDNVSAKDNDTGAGLAIQNISVNEGSSHAVFTVTGAVNAQINDIIIADGDAAGGNLTNGLSDNDVEYWDGASWLVFNNTTPINIDGTGTLLLRISITDEQDTFADDAEQFRLTVTPASGVGVVGTGTIKDDGTSVKYPGTVTANAPDTDATNLDNDTDLLFIDDVIVNEASDYAINSVAGPNNLVLNNLSVLGSGDTVIQNFDMKVYDFANSTWEDFVAGSTQLNDVGEMLVRTTIIEERDDERDNGEVFTLSVNPTGTVTIMDNGTGRIFTGAINPATGAPVTVTVGLDNDGYENQAYCGWEATSGREGGVYFTRYFDIDGWKTVIIREYDNYTSYEIL